MPRPAQWFTRALEVVDPLLSVRFGNDIGQWVIERKAYVPPEEVAFLRRQRGRMAATLSDTKTERTNAQRSERKKDFLACCEELTSAECGKRVIMVTALLNQNVFNLLHRADIQAYGGHARFADALEAEEERSEKDAQRIHENKMKAVHGEVWDILKFLNARRGVALDRREQDLKYMLHGKRKEVGEEMLPLEVF